MENNNKHDCGGKNGALPSCAPLALAYVPMQQSSLPQYEPAKGIMRGTLFPGLDLPLFNIVNTGELANTPLGELMALDFASHELRLYLDTHADDTEAFSMLQELLKLAKEAHRRYTKLCGPVKPCDLLEAQSFTWLNNPWPWDYPEKQEG